MSKVAKPTIIDELAKALVGREWKNLTPLGEVFILDDEKLAFSDIEASFIKEQSFARHIPIVRELVSDKKFDNRVITHVVLWLDDGIPYLYTPDPTIEFKRINTKVEKFMRGDYFMIPHHCRKYDILALRHGTNLWDNSPLLELSVTRNQLG